MTNPFHHTIRPKTLVIRLTEEGHKTVLDYSIKEERTLSDMARVLLAEAVAARAKRVQR